MPLMRSEGWPLVLVNDDGLRPAGNPGECFYCGRKIGDEHSRECVVVYKVVRYGVYIGDRRIGTFDNPEPHGWDEETCERIRNQGSWCADNAVDRIDGISCEDIARIEAHDGCSCSLLEFRLESILDAGPLVEVPETPQT